MRSRALSALTLLAALTGALPAGAQQQELDYVTYVGVFVPLNDVIDDFGVRFKHKTAFGLGGRGTLWVEEALAFEGSFVFNFSDVEVEDSEGVSTEGGHVWYGTGRVLYRPRRRSGSAFLFVGAGLTVAGRGGTAYSGITGTTDIGGTVGVGASLGVGKGFSVRIEAEDYFSWARFNPNLALETSTRFQNDLVFSAGLAVPIVR